MKATGIVRRIDDLGRIVIPKELRRTMRIQEGTPLEIFIDEGGGVVFRKYSSMEELTDLAEKFTEVLFSVTGKPVLISDTEKIIAVSGMAKKDLLGKGVRPEISEMLLGERVGCEVKRFEGGCELTEGSEKKIDSLCPVFSDGDPVGAIMTAMSDRGGKPGDELLRFSAMLLGKQGE